MDAVALPHVGVDRSRTRDGGAHQGLVGRSLGAWNCVSEWAHHEVVPGVAAMVAMPAMTMVGLSLAVVPTVEVPLAAVVGLAWSVEVTVVGPAQSVEAVVWGLVRSWVEMPRVVHVVGPWQREWRVLLPCAGVAWPRPGAWPFAWLLHDSPGVVGHTSPHRLGQGMLRVGCLGPPRRVGPLRTKCRTPEVSVGTGP